MEIKIENKDKLFLIAAIIGFIAFFLPWIGGGFIGRLSGYELLTYGKEFKSNESWFLLIFPISFLIIVFSKLSIIKKISPTLLKIIEILPIILILFSFSKLGIKLKDLSEIDSSIFEIIHIGFILTIISSIVVVFETFKKENEEELIIEPEIKIKLKQGERICNFYSVEGEVQIATKKNKGYEIGDRIMVNGKENQTIKIAMGLRGFILVEDGIIIEIKK